MKLYIKPGACSLSPHIVVREAGLPVEVVRADTKAPEFLQINPKGYIPVLELDNGQRLTEGVAIVQYLADAKPEAQLAPKNGTFERYRLQEMLNYIATELHKGFSPLFRKPSPEQKKVIVEGIEKKLAFIDQHLANNPYLLGERYTVADAYLFTILTWRGAAGIDLSRYASLNAWNEKVAARPAVKEALAAERS